MMYSHLETVPVRDLISTEAPTFVAALFIAEASYKFHSFTLEVLAFLATWYALAAGTRWLRHRQQRARKI